jgi:amidohydrolase
MVPKLFEHLVSVRRRLHENPELGYCEFRTSELIANELKILGIPFETNVAHTGTGIIASLKKGTGPTIILRADMDALPICEQTDLPFSSTVENRMHACGHDLHVTMLLGAAYILKDADFNGTIKFLFQPSEEGNSNDPVVKGNELKKSGGQRIAESGIFEGVSAAVGLHVNPLKPAGNLSYCLGSALACVAFFEIQINGIGGHAAFPHLAVDPIFIGSHFILAAQGIISRYTAPNESKVISFTNIKIGNEEVVLTKEQQLNAENIIPGSISLYGTIRALDFDVYKTIKEKLQGIANGFKISFGADIEIQYTLEYPSLINDKILHSKLLMPLTKVFGSENITEETPLLGGEDFAFYSRQVPSIFYFLGANFGGRKEFLHNSKIIFNEDCIPFGTDLFVQSALELLK